MLLRSYIDSNMVSTQVYLLVNVCLKLFFLTCSTMKKWLHWDLLLNSQEAVLF
jgi:hypothetical protein